MQDPNRYLNSNTRNSRAKLIKDISRGSETDSVIFHTICGIFTDQCSLPKNWFSIGPKVNAGTVAGSIYFPTYVWNLCIIVKTDFANLIVF